MRPDILIVAALIALVLFSDGLWAWREVVL
jgi:hypothetical protein